jgi:hypothetical protein
MTVEPAASRRSLAPFVAALLIVGSAAAVVGAWLDWRWWPVYSGLTITLVAFGLLIVGGILALIPRRPVRRAGLLVLAAGVGALLGQNLGPSREALILGEGTVTLTLERPFTETTTAVATCNNVASGTEVSMSGDPNMRLSDRSFVSVYVDSGDRWAVTSNAPRSNGVRLQIDITPERVPDDGRPSSVGMQATPSSTVEAAFTSEGGRVRFSGLEPMTDPDHDGTSLDLAGTIEWTCDEVLNEP